MNSKMNSKMNTNKKCFLTCIILILLVIHLRPSCHSTQVQQNTTYTINTLNEVEINFDHPCLSGQNLLFPITKDALNDALSSFQFVLLNQIEKATHHQLKFITTSDQNQLTLSAVWHLTCQQTAKKTIEITLNGQINAKLGFCQMALFSYIQGGGIVSKENINGIKETLSNGRFISQRSHFAQTLNQFSTSLLNNIRHDQCL